MSYATNTARPITMRWHDTKQLAILKFIVAHLEGIIYGDYDDTGEHATLAGRVFVGKLLFSAKEPTPFLSILEGKRPDIQPDFVGADNLQRLEQWHLMLQGWITDDANHPLDNLYRLKGVVEERLAQLVQVVPETGNAAFPALYLCARMIDTMSIGPGVVRPSTDEEGGTEAFYLPMVITFAMNVADPFAVT